MFGPVLAIDQNNVGPAVVVVINEGAARAHGFGKIFLPEGRVVVGEVDSGLGGDVAEGDLAGNRESGEENAKQGYKGSYRRTPHQFAAPLDFVLTEEYVELRSTEPVRLPRSARSLWAGLARTAVPTWTLPVRFVVLFVVVC